MTKFYNWCYTRFINEDETDECERDPQEFMADINVDKKVVFHIWQIETAPRTHRRHIQGYVELNADITLSACKHLLGDKAHIEAARGTQEENINYCSKQESKYAGPWTFGKKKRPGQRNDILTLYEMLRGGHDEQQLIETDPVTYLKYYKAFDRAKEMLLKRKAINYTPKDKKKDLKVIALTGEAGTGKTRYVYDKHSIEDIYSLPYTTNNWFNGYQGQKILLIDEMGPGRIPIDKLLLMLDIYPQQYEIKGGMTWGLWTTVYLTSNYSVRQWYPDLPNIKFNALERRIHKIKTFPKIIDYESFIDEETKSESSSEDY